MNNFGKNAMGALLGTFYLMCFAFPVGLFLDVFRDKMPIGQFLGNQIVIFFVVWFVGYFFVKEYREWIAERNKPRQDDNKHDVSKPGPSDATKDDSKPDNAKNVKPDSDDKH
ncbi:hypothetical protein KA344_06605 [bacterium]|jgi:hypothetical protein|nr:hypothetical protein [bacterium]